MADVAGVVPSVGRGLGGGLRDDAGAASQLRRQARRPARQLTESALQALGELGYARASLRGIAANSEFSHGVVHYYFHDELELIVYCLRFYRAQRA